MRRMVMFVSSRGHTLSGRLVLRPESGLGSDFHQEAKMRLLTQGDVRVGDTLTREDDRYSVVRLEPSSSNQTICEIAKLV